MEEKKETTGEKVAPAVMCWVAALVFALFTCFTIWGGGWTGAERVKWALLWGLLTVLATIYGFVRWREFRQAKGKLVRQGAELLGDRG